MKQVADGIRAVISGLQMIADALENTEVGEPIETTTEVETPPTETPDETPPKNTETSKKAVKPKKDEPPQITETDVRKLLSGKAQAGFTKEVKELLAKYGSPMISKLDPQHYAAVMKEAEGIQ